MTIVYCLVFMIALILMLAVLWVFAVIGLGLGRRG